MVVALAKADPVDSVCDVAKLGHLLAVTIALLSDTCSQLRSRIVAHDRLLAEGTMAVAAEDGGSLLTPLQVDGEVDQQGGREVILHVDDPALSA